MDCVPPADRRPSLGRQPSLGDKLIEIIRSQVIRDYIVLLHRTELQEISERTVIANDCFVQFYPIYIDCCIESERQLRDAVEKEEKKERVRCPGCMEAHLWLLIASESAQRRVGQREETQADREKRMEAERQRKSLLAQKWAETKEGLLLQQRIEEDMIQKKQKLKADEAYARRKLLEDERYEWRDYLLEKKARGRPCFAVLQYCRFHQSTRTAAICSVCVGATC